MTAIKMEELERLDKEYGLEPDGLTYQLRCSRIAAVIKGEEWVKPEKKKPQKEPASPKTMDIKASSLYGTRVIITPMIHNFPIFPIVPNTQIIYFFFMRF